MVMKIGDHFEQVGKFLSLSLSLSLSSIFAFRSPSRFSVLSYLLFFYLFIYILIKVWFVSFRFEASISTYQESIFARNEFS